LETKGDYRETNKKRGGNIEVKGGKNLDKSVFFLSGESREGRRFGEWEHWEKKVYLGAEMQQGGTLVFRVMKKRIRVKYSLKTGPG